MRLPWLIRRAIFRVLYKQVAMKRPPDQFIGEGPYMMRWWLFGASKKRDDSGGLQPRRPLGYSFYFHCFLRSDDDRALHDHPWDFLTVILFGRYEEHRNEDAAYLIAPDLYDYRGANNIQVRDTRRHYDDPVRVIRGYLEGSVIRSKAADLHRVALHPQSGGRGPAQSAFGRSPHRMTDLPWMTSLQANRVYEMWRKEEPAWTLFMAGRWQRKWGFMCEHGWKHWRDFDADGGCGEP